VSPHELDPSTLHPVHLAVVVPIVDNPVAPREGCRSIELAGDCLARPIDALGSADCHPGPEKRL
jgi:hypothetical protein